MKIKINQNLSTPFGKFKKDEVIEVATDSDGVPLQKFWRNRLQDSHIDNCVEIFVEKKAEEKPIETSESNEEADSIPNKKQKTK